MLVASFRGVNCVLIDHFRILGIGLELACNEG